MAFSWGDVGKLVGSAAPIVGTALGGPAGGAVGSMIASLLGVEDKPDAVASAIKADPSIVVKMKELEVEAHKLELEAIEKARQAELEEVRMQLADVTDARDRQIKHEQATGKSDINLYVLAWVVVFGFFVLVGMTMFVKIEDSTGAVFMLFGTMATGFGMVLQYFFGSSKSSSDKTVQMADMVKVNKK